MTCHRFGALADARAFDTWIRYYGEIITETNNKKLIVASPSSQCFSVGNYRIIARCRK